MYKFYTRKPGIPNGYIHKLWLIMRLTTLILIVTLMQVSAAGFAQRVTLNQKKASLEKIFREIHSQTGYDFMYNREIINKKPPVDILVKNEALEVVLQKCLDGQSLEYSIEDKMVVIKEKSVINKVKDFLATPIDVHGRVVDSVGAPLVGANIRLKNGKTAVLTDSNGEFVLRSIDDKDMLTISYLGYKTREIAAAKELGNIKLDIQESRLDEVKIVNTGYQIIKPNEATGSVSVVDNKLFNRSISQNVLDRIDNIVPGVMFDRTTGAPDPILIRGRGTIFSSAAPLVVLNNFPYDGDISDINPNDVESVTVLKDAAAASIWGAKAGNGVIVITTKQGKTTKPQIQVNSNVSIGQKPDLRNVSSVSSADFIELEKWAFDQGAYNGLFTSDGKPGISPVVEILQDQKNGLISSATANAKINAFKSIDSRDEISKYMYQSPIAQQYSANVSGSNPNLNYYASFGYDKNIGELVSVNSDRITIRSQNMFNVSQKLKIDLGISYVQNNSRTGNNQGMFTSNRGLSIYPYAQLLNSNGDFLPINTNYRTSFTNQAMSNGLMDWTYNPIKEINATETLNEKRDIVVNSGFTYDLFSGLKLTAKYQFETYSNPNSTTYSNDSYYVRDMINTFYQVSTKSSPIPNGAIVDNGTSVSTSHQARVQLNYEKAFGKHLISGLAGYEIKQNTDKTSVGRIYGYDPSKALTVPNIDYVTNFVSYVNPNISNKIVPVGAIGGTTDRFISEFANLSYNYDQRYTLSASAREDAANLFGVNTNQKGTPLWSIGTAWQINNEKFYKVDWLPILRLKATYGINGNISRLTSAYPTASYSNAFYYPTVLSAATIINPPNYSLRWERIENYNFGLEFQTKDGIISGSIDFYLKNGKDLMGSAPADPTYGLTSGIFNGVSEFFGNVAEMKGRGIDIELNSKNIRGKFNWNSTLLFSKATSEVTKYLMPVSSSGQPYLASSVINPVIGRPVYSVYSFKTAGLSHNTGDPQGYLNGNISTDYTAIANQPLASYVYNGNLQPTIFGAFRNNFAYKNVAVSVNISYRFGSYFRAPSVDYSAVVGPWRVNADYYQRWQNPGDEAHTTVLSMQPILSANYSQRQLFYNNSDVLVEKADNIRLEDINFSYDFQSKQLGKYFKQIRLYGQVNSLGTIWVANRKNIDPNFLNVPKSLAKFAFGINLIL